MATFFIHFHFIKFSNETLRFQTWEMSSPYQNWILFSLAHLFLTLNFLVIKHYLLDQDARLPFDLTKYFNEHLSNQASFYERAVRQSIERIIDQVCRFIVTNLVTANLAATVWFLIGSPSKSIRIEILLAALGSTILNVDYFLTSTLPFYVAITNASASPIGGLYLHDSGLLIILNLALYRVFKSKWFIRINRLLCHLLFGSEPLFDRHLEASHKARRLSALFLISWLTNHLIHGLIHQLTFFGRPIQATPLNLYAYFVVMFMLPLIARRIVPRPLHRNSSTKKPSTSYYA